MGLEQGGEGALHLLDLVFIFLAVDRAPHFEPNVFLLVNHAHSVDSFLDGSE